MVSGVQNRPFLLEKEKHREEKKTTGGSLCSQENKKRMK